MPVKASLARCALTGKEFSCAELVRLVYTEPYGWCVDRKGNLPGQVCWIQPSAVQIRLYAENKLSVSPSDLTALLDGYLLQHIQQTLSLARRAGEFCIGGDRIKQWWQQHSDTKDVFLLRAHDGGSVKLWSFLQAQGRTADNASLSQSELGAVFQRSALGSVLVLNYGFCQILRRECAKLALLRAA